MWMKEKSRKVNSTFSSYLTVLIGIPQQSILGTMLFSIFLDDIFSFFFMDTGIILMALLHAETASTI